MAPDSVVAVAAAVPLSDEWGGTYLQVIVTLIIFALGIPAILIQTVAPELHRIAVSRRYDGSRTLLGMTAVCLILAFGYVAVYHYDSPGWMTPSDGALGLVSTAMVAVIIGVWLRQLRLPARDRLARQLGKSAWRSFRKKGAIPDSLLNDLRDLGIAVHRGPDRRVVLEAMQTLVLRVRVSPRYHGDGLDRLLTAVGEVAADPALPVDADNVELGASILLAASRPHRPVAADTAPSADMSEAVRAFVRMLLAITLKAPETSVKKLLQQFSAMEPLLLPLAAKGLFQVGRRALEAGRFQLAMMCLNHLEDVLEGCSPNQRATVETNLLGLTSHLWDRCPAARQRLLQRPVIARFVRSLTRERRREYVESYLEQSDFQTAGCISSFCRGLAARRVQQRAEPGRSVVPAPSAAPSKNGTGPSRKAPRLVHALMLALASRLLN